MVVGQAVHCNMGTDTANFSVTSTTCIFTQIALVVVLAVKPLTALGQHSLRNLLPLNH